MPLESQVYILYQIMSETHQPNKFPITFDPLGKQTRKGSKLCQYEYNVANKLGYFGVTLNRFSQDASTGFEIVSTSVFVQIIFW